MNDESKTLLTIITEASLEKKLCKQIERLGVKGYTISDARGKGDHGSRDAEWDQDGNIRIEVIGSENLANKIKELLKAEYLEDFAMIIFSHPVDVLRSGKFN